MLTLTPLRKQIIKFTLTGMMAVLVDMAVYYSMLYILKGEAKWIWGHEVWAKTTSFMFGVLVTSHVNRLWTGKQNDRDNKRLAKFTALYSTALVVNVGTNTFLLYLLHSFSLFEPLPYKYMIAFLGATGVSAVMNFIGQKLWVFKSKESAE
jgi:putative flippase GtrA